MRILTPQHPTPEQLPILRDSSPGVLLIRGAAGSGKTTTALMRLRQLCAVWLARRDRLELTDPVRVLVLTYNRTLEGYIAKLAADQVTNNPALHLEVRTFAKFAKDLVQPGSVISSSETAVIVGGLARNLDLRKEFVISEVDYVLGRFEPGDLESYMSVRRDGRGTTPQMTQKRRRALLDEVIYPYMKWKSDQKRLDWNDLAVAAQAAPGDPWDVIVVDEAQDFSANEVRAIMAHVAADYSVTFVMDSAQRIYPRAFTWREVGLSIPTSRKLTQNHRNTVEIAAFARPLVDGLTIGDDGALPDFNATEVHGDVPVVLSGSFSGQTRYAIDNIVKKANLADESVAFLHVRGGGYFDYLEAELRRNQIPWVQLQRNDVWPGGTETVALSTLHSAKGLEFDHVIILGLNQDLTPHGDEDDDAQLDSLRRLVAMGIGRARKTVTIGYKPDEASTLVQYFEKGTFKAVAV